ncbi:MAG: efflux RND transporter periplasmic adaptor subunit [Coriobacteriia bacterium]|nr:efflux RND transporter periplasmic adaptor subunit [Coriobacteriia bacterium]MBN2841036.1 efflux RND transporter periplasmic adaptor subunit [Coriobacteriia bacterium]
MSKKIRARIALTLVLIVAAAAVAFAITGSDIETVEVAEATREDLAVLVSASGQVEADDSIDVYPPTAGTIASIEVTEGDRVTAGQVLAFMDTAPIEVQVAQAQAAYEGAMAQRDAISRTAPGAGDIEAAEAAVAAARTAYEAADAAYTAAVSGVGGVGSTEIAQAEAAVTLARTVAEAAQAAYDAYYENVYLPAPEPRDAALESTLTTLESARDQTAASLDEAEEALATISTGIAQADIISARMARDQAYAAYLGASSQRDALIRGSDLSGARSSADAAVAAAEAALAYAKQTLDRAEIVAPRDGIVSFAGSSGTSLLAGAGVPAVSAGLSEGGPVTPAAPLFTIMDLSEPVFRAQIDETDIARIKPGMNAEVALDGFAARTFAAEVERIGISSVLTVTGGTAFPVWLRFRADGEPVLLGMNGSVEIEIETIGSAVSIPVEALLEDRATAYVYTVRDGRAQRVDIEIGTMTDTRVEVLSGLAEGETVIVSGVGDLADGARVEVE